MTLGQLPVMPEDWQFIVYVPSIALGPLTRRHLQGLDYFQERNYYLAAALTDPRKRVIVILSNEMGDELLNAHLDTLSKALSLPRDRYKNFYILRVEHPSNKSLSRAILDDDATLTQLRSIIEGRVGGLDFWTVGHDEVELAEELRLPHLGMPATVTNADSKTNGKRIFNNAGVPAPVDFGIYRNLVELLRDFIANKFPLTGTLLLKLNHEEGGNGIARIALSSGAKDLASLRAAVVIDKPYISLSEFENEMEAQGALAELFLEGNIIASPSAKMWIDDNAKVHCLGTHDQILSNSMYLGCRFPADAKYRAEVIRHALSIGHVCAEEGWRGLVSVDFLATENDLATQLWAIEINARKSATTHPYYWARTLTGAEYLADQGTLVVGDRSLVYETSEYIFSPSLADISSHEILEIIEQAGLNYDPRSREGVLIHMLSSARTHSKIGITAISAQGATAAGYIRDVGSLFRSREHALAASI